MSYITNTLLTVIGLFAGMLIVLEIGRRVGRRRMEMETEGARAGLGAVEGAVFALLGLLIAFCFSGAAGRFDSRKMLIVQEANAIGTAWLRLDLLPASAQPELRDLFRRYTDSRLKMYQNMTSIQALKKAQQDSMVLQSEIWTRAVAVTRSQEVTPQATMLLLPALNEMFDIMSTRMMAMQTHPPLIIFAMLCALALAGALFAGYGMAGGGKRSWIHVIGFSAIMSLTVYIILDIEFPRMGLIRVDGADQMLVEVRQGMNPSPAVVKPETR